MISIKPPRTKRTARIMMVVKIRRLKKQVEGLENFMDEKGYQTNDEMLGIASDAAMAYCDMPAEKARVIEENCINCKMCLKTCFSDLKSLKEKPLK